MLSSESWLSVVPVLAKYYRIVIPDLIGFGYIEKPHVDYTIDFSINFLKKFLKLLNISDVNIIGSSDGGLLALEYAIKYGSEVEKLVLVSPAGTMRYVSTTSRHYTCMALYPTYENISRILQQMIYDPKMISETLIYDLINRIKIPNFKYSFMSKLMNLNDHPKLTIDRLNIDVPTLIIWGRNDKLNPVRYAKNFKIPKSKIVILDNCGHYPHIEKPSEFSNIV